MNELEVKSEKGYEPPNSVEGEMCALGAMMLSERGAREVMSLLSENDFYRPAHKAVFSAVSRLVHKGEAVDPVTIPAAMGADVYERIGGFEYVIALMDSVPSAHNARHYAQIVLDLAIRRRVFEFVREAGKWVFDPDLTVADLVAKVQESAGDLRTGEQFAFHVADLLNSAKDKPKTAIPTGLRKFDSVTSKGGLGGGRVHLIGGETGAGKSWLGVQLTQLSADRGNRECFVSLEMDGTDISNRFCQQLCGYPDRVEACENHDEQVWDDAVLRLKLSDVTIVDGSKFMDGLSVDAIISWLWAEHHVYPWTGVTIDYAQLVECNKHREEWRNLAVVARRFRNFALKSGICVRLLVQIDKVEGRFQVRGSREFHKEASTFVYLDRAGVGDKTRPDYLVVEKNRYGKSKFKIEVELLPRFFRWIEADDEPFESPEDQPSRSKKGKPAQPKQETIEVAPVPRGNE